MLIGHSACLTNNWSNWLSKFIFSFHMPLFYIFSGYFFREQSARTSIMTGVRKLVVPYIITVCVGVGFVFIFSNKPAPEAVNWLKGALVGTLGNKNSAIRFWPLQVGPIWFLLSLYFCRIVFNFCYTHWRKHIVDITVALSIIFYYIGNHWINIPLCIGNGMSVLIFYLAGFQLKNRGGLQPIKKVWILCAIWIFAICFTKLNCAQYIYTYYPLSVCGAICGTIVVYRLCSYLPEFCIRSLAYVGRNALPVLCCHSVAFITKNSFLEFLGYDASNRLYDDIAYMALTISFIVLYIIIRYIFVSVIKNGEESINLG